MTNFTPRKWELTFDGTKYRVYEGDIEVALVQEEKYARMIAAEPELYWSWPSSGVMPLGRYVAYYV